MRSTQMAIGLWITVAAVSGCASAVPTTAAAPAPAVDPQLVTRINQARDEVLALFGVNPRATPRSSRSAAKLARLLTLPGAVVDGATARALIQAGLRDPRILPALIADLDAGRASVRHNALQFVGAYIVNSGAGRGRKLPDPTAVVATRDRDALAGHLVRAAADQNLAVRHQALVTMRRVGLSPPCAFGAALDAFWQGADRKLRTEALRLGARLTGCAESLHAAHRSAVLAALGDTDRTLRGEAASWLYRMTPLGVAPSIGPWVARFSTTADRRVKHALAMYLARSGTPQARRALREARRTVSNVATRGVVTLALAAMGEPGIEGALLALLPIEGSVPRDDVIEALGRLKSRRAVTPLMALVMTTGAAAEALADIGDPAAVSSLQAMFFHPMANPHTFEAAAGGLRRLDPDGTVAFLTDLLSHGSARKRRRAAKALSFLKDPRALAALVAQRGHGDAGTRAMVMRALGAMPWRAALPHVLAGLRDHAADVRFWAIDALADLQRAESVPAILGALEDQRPDVRSRACSALGRIKDPAAVRALVATAAVRTGDAEVCQQALSMLGSRADARKVLWGLSSHANPVVRRRSTQGLMRHVTGVEVTTMGTRLHDTDPTTRRWACVALTLRATVRSFGALAAAGVEPCR